MSTIAAGAVGGASLTTLSGTAAAWDQFDVAFPDEHEVWFIVGNDLHYDPPLVTHVIVDTSDGATCRLVEFTEENATTYPQLFGERPVIRYDAGDETVLGVLPYNRHHSGDGRFSRPRCVLLNEHVDEADAVKASKNVDCVQTAMEKKWDGNFKTCWFEAVEHQDVPDENRIDECRKITEPGTYKLVADLEPTTEETCLEIRAEDVRIDGNGHTISGAALPDDAESVGILSAATPETRLPSDDSLPITITNVNITGFENGVLVSKNDTVRLKRSEITDCDRGVDLAVDLNNISMSLEDVTIKGCTRDGFRSIGFHTVDITDSEFTQNGIGITVFDTGLELTTSTISENDETGLNTSDTFVEVADTLIEKNGGDGFTHRFTGMIAENVTLRENDGRQVGVLGPSPPESVPAMTFEATDVAIGNTTTVDAPGTGVNALDAIPEDELASLPDSVTPVAEGFEVITTVTTELDVRFEFESTEKSVELLRFDGADWDSVTETSGDDGLLEARIDKGGIYVPVK